jgi:hypothetical protein
MLKTFFEIMGKKKKTVKRLDCFRGVQAVKSRRLIANIFGVFGVGSDQKNRHWIGSIFAWDRIYICSQLVSQLTN